MATWSCGLLPGTRSLDSLEDQRCVDAAKSEVVRHDVIDLDSAGLVHDVVESRASIVHHGEVDGGNEKVVAHHSNGEPSLDGAAGAERMAEVTLERVQGRRGAEHGVGRPSFLDIAPLGRGTMSTDETNRTRIEASVVESEAERDFHGLRARLGGVVAVAIARKTDDFRKNRRATRQRALPLFEHQGDRTLANNKSVAIAVVGTRAHVRRVVPRRGSKQRVENRGLGYVELIRTACDHYVSFAPADRLRSVADRLAARCAGR